MQVRILGPVEVLAQDGALVPIPPRERSALVGLLLDAGHVVSRARLTEVLWGDDPPSTASDQVYTCVHRLRRRLRAAGIAEITTVDGGYRLDVPPELVDSLMFARMVSQALQAKADLRWQDAIAHFRAADRLWRGPALAGVGSEALRSAAVTLDDQRLGSLEERVTLELAYLPPNELVGELAELVQRHPFRERLLYALVRALYQADRKAEALEVYERARARFADELGLDPGRTLRALHQAILRDQLPVPDPSLPPAGADPALTRHLPEHPVPRQLPADPAFFVGRRASLDQLHALLPDPTRGTRPAVVTLVGGAGVGKTAVAVHWARRVADRFPDGQLYVHLRGFKPHGRPAAPSDALQSLLMALGVPPWRLPTTLDALVGLYRSLLADRRMLLLLDDARDPDQVRPMLPGAPGVMVVVTSRHQLSGLVATEAAVPVVLDLFTDEEAYESLAIRLGPNRLRGQAPAVSELLAACVGLPLALAVAATRVTVRPTFPLAAIAAELRDTGAGLGPWFGTDPAADLRAVFTGSYRSLTPPAARLFRLLGRHPAWGITAPTAADLAGVPSSTAHRLLAELADVHMLAEPAPGQFTQHDLLRKYASELASDSRPRPGARCRRQ